MDRTLPVLDALLTTLKADATLSGIVSDRIYTHPPQNPVYPLVLIGLNSGPSNYIGEIGQTHEITCQAFSEKHTPHQVLNITATIHNLLHRTDLSISAGVATSFRHERSDLILEDDNKSYQGIIVFTIDSYS